MELGYSTTLVEEGVITPKWLFKTDTPSPPTSVTPSRNNDAIDAMALQQRTQRIWGPLCVFLVKNNAFFLAAVRPLHFPLCSANVFKCSYSSPPCRRGGWKDTIAGPVGET
jgi:hypothetical protein